MWVTGQIVDDRGRALPGVMVQASGPAAVSMRAAVSNAQGKYAMQDLRPGTCTTTFCRPGFSTVQRRIDVVSSFVATINAHLHAGTR